MQKNYKRKDNANLLGPLFFFVLILLCFACSKTSQKPEEAVKAETDIYAYEVTCIACDIQFMDKNKSMQEIANNNGKWSYSFEKASNADLKINVITRNSAYQNISAYILKNNDVVYGDLGYNNFELIYNVKSGQKSMNFGSYSGGSNGSGSGGGSTKSTSSVCGAQNKTGGYCKRVVSGGGRCWQHS